MVQEFEDMFQKEFEDKTFSMTSVDNILDNQLTLDNLKTKLTSHAKSITTVRDAIVRAKMIFRNAFNPDSIEMQAAFTMYDHHMRKSGDTN